MDRIIPTEAIDLLVFQDEAIVLYCGNRKNGCEGSVTVYPNQGITTRIAAAKMAIEEGWKRVERNGQGFTSRSILCPNCHKGLPHE